MANLLDWIKTKELKGRADRISVKDSKRINWFNGDIGGLPATVKPPKDKSCTPDPNERIQQSDLLKPLLKVIAIKGLEQAYKDFKDVKIPFISAIKTDKASDSVLQTTNPKHVIIVGGGMAGMGAAYELQRVGHRVTILEMTQRVGGRVKTFDEKNGFDKGLHSDGK